MFFVCHKKLFLVFILIAVLVLPVFVKSPDAITYASSSYTVVIDAGHGGKDKGAISEYSGVFESDLNLQFSKVLEKYFKIAGVKVVQTRKDKNALGNGDRFIKRLDMNARLVAIKKAKPDMVISHHMNKFSEGKNQTGAQVFYQSSDTKSGKLAEIIQQKLNKEQVKKRSALGGDFFILRNCKSPAVIIECGFLSNIQEEKLLQTKSHQEKVCESIFLGAMEYLLK